VNAQTIFLKGSYLLTSPHRITTRSSAKFSGEAVMKSPIVKRSVVIDGHKTSVSLEDAFWNDLREIAHYQRVTVPKLLENIDKGRQGNLSSAIRLFVFDQVRRHGDFWQYSRDRRLGKPPQTGQEVKSNAEAISAVS
jgi:predicted DNA-binding ribbon-helix-helix protein